MRWFWGTILILFGLIALGLNTNIINHSQLSQLGQLWPLLLVIYGAGLIFHRFKYGWVLTLLIIFCSLCFTTAVLKDRISYKPYSGPRQHYKFSEDLKATTQDSKLTINSGAVDLNISDTHNYLISGQLNSNYLKPNLIVNYNDTQATSTLNTDSSFDFWPHGKNEFNVKVSDQTPTKLVVNVGASKIDANLSNILLKELTVNSGASDINIRLGNQTRNGAKIDFSSGASSIKILVPKSIGIEAKNNSPISSFSFKNSQKIDSKTYKSDNYGSSEKKIEIDISSGASSIEINTY